MDALRRVVDAAALVACIGDHRARKRANTSAAGVPGCPPTCRECLHLSWGCPTTRLVILPRRTRVFIRHRQTWRRDSCVRGEGPSSNPTFLRKSARSVSFSLGEREGAPAWRTMRV